MAPRIHRSTERAHAPANRQAEDIALACLGAGPLSADALAEDAFWDRTGASRSMGRAAILDSLRALPVPQSVTVSEVVTHGKAGSVSGHVTREGVSSLFCHVIRFTTASAQQIAQIVSFERREAGHG